MTFAECIPLLLEGKTISRESYGKHYNLWALSLSEYRGFESVLKEKYDLAVISRSDLEANDWEVVE